MANKLWAKILASAFAVVTALSACDMKPTVTAPEAGVEEYTRTDERATALNTQGQWLFKRNLRGLNSAEHYVIDALFLQPQGSFTLHSHFNGYAYRDGVKVRFIRDGEKFQLGFAAPEMSERLFDLPHDWIAADGRLRVRLEVHNADPGGPRLLIWKYALSFQGEQEQPRDFISATNADFDSVEEKVQFTTHGHGVRWGIEFDQVSILKAYGEAPYVP